MNRLELKHIATYFPYKVRVIGVKKKYNIDTIIDKVKIVWNSGVTADYFYMEDYIGILFTEIDIKLVLRPLSDISNIIEHNCEKFRPFDVLAKRAEEYVSEKDIQKKAISELLGNYSQVEKLIEWHFDIYGLIEKGLAIDFNKLNKE